jgi:hypothetical protein
MAAPTADWPRAASARWVAAAESGTGSLLGAAIGRYTDAEQPLAGGPRQPAESQEDR